MTNCSTIQQSDVLILGAGVSGLAAAREVESRGRRATVLEACPTPGGLTRTAEVNEFCFDYTGHFLHLAQHGLPADLPHAGLRNEDWIQVDRRSRCYVAGSMIDAPIQYNLGQLPPPVLDRCRASYDSRPTLPAGSEGSFEDVVICGFGQELADMFLIPQNRKTLSLSLDKLSQRGIRRFFPLPDESRIRVGMRPGGGSKANEYNSSFWYPKLGGIRRLVDGLASGLGDLRLKQRVVKLDLASRTLWTSDGQKYRWKTLLSSAPLRDLCLMTGDRELVDAAGPLSCGSTIAFNLGIEGTLPEALRDVHWIYVPDPSVSFYRVGVYSNINQGACAAGYHAMYVEVGVAGDQLPRQDIVRDLQPRVFSELARLGWLDIRSVRCVCIQTIACAYAHLTPHREQVLSSIRSRLAGFGVLPIGRYGLWDYTGMEDCIMSAIQCVRENGL